MTKPQYVTAPMPVHLGPGSGEVGSPPKIVTTAEARIAELEVHRRQWRSVAFRLADALRAIADRQTGDLDVDVWEMKEKARTTLEAADLDGVER